MGSPDESEMAEVDAEGDSGEAKQSRTYTGDSDDECFGVEAIKSCKLGSMVRHSSRICHYRQLCPRDQRIAWEHLPQQLEQTVVPLHA
jgi:hypothetical protein